MAASVPGKFASIALIVVVPAPAGAETLRDALIETYSTNPTLMSQRQALRAIDATVAIAATAGRPQVSGTLGMNRTLSQSGSLADYDKGPYLTTTADLSYPLFSAGSVRNSVEAAKTRVEAGRATLRQVEGSVLTDVVTAYMNVIRDRAIVELNQSNVKVLERTLEATREQFGAGDLTRTDVAQAEARLSGARANLANATSTLLASEATYRQVVGHSPAVLASPPPLPDLPATPERAVQIALSNNPELIAITRQAEAAGYDVKVARASRLPTVSLAGSAEYENTLAGDTGPYPRGAHLVSVGVSTRVPLYQGGLPAARIRQAQAQEGQQREQMIGTERAVVQAVRAAFATYHAAEKAIESDASAVQADELALEGARAEQSVGTRTVLEVLNAEQELLTSRVALVTAHRDAYVAGFALLNSMGEAEAASLGLDGGPLYGPLRKPQ